MSLVRFQEKEVGEAEMENSLVDCLTVPHCASHSWVPPHSDFIYLKKGSEKQEVPRLSTNEHMNEAQMGLCYSTPHSPLVPVSESHSRITKANRF